MPGLLRVILYILVLLVSTLLVCGTIFYYVEAGAQEAQGRGLSLYDAVYWAFVTATTIGYGDITPLTPLGRMVAGVTAVAGIASFTALVGVIANYLVEGSTRRLLGMEEVRQRSHIVVLGWNPIVAGLLGELRANLGRAVVAVAASDAPAGLEGVRVVRGDPLAKEVLSRAGVARASHVLVALEEDSKTVLGVLHARRLNRSARIIALVFDEENSEIVEQAGADHVVPASIASVLMASYVYEPHVPEVVVDLASTLRGSSDLVEASARDYAGLSYWEAVAKAKKEHDSLILAVVRDGVTMVNPPADMVLRETDVLVVVEKSGIGPNGSSANNT